MFRLVQRYLKFRLVIYVTPYEGLYNLSCQGTVLRVVSDIPGISLVFFKITYEKRKSTPDNSNLQGKSKKVPVLRSSKKIAGSKGKTVLTA